MRFVAVFILYIYPTVSVTAQTDSVSVPVTAKPNNGEGVWAFLHRHYLTTEHLGEFKELNKGKFTADGGLLSHHAYILPVINQKWIVPIFGKESEELTLRDEELKGAVFYLVSGHGGPDPGAIGDYGIQQLYEDEYAYDITLRLAKNLMQAGATVHLIVHDADDGIRSDAYLEPDTDETVMGQTIPLNQIERLKQRCNKINELDKKEKSKYRRCIEIHLDSRSQKKQLDVFFYHHKGSKKGKSMAETIRKTFEENYRKHQPNRGFSGTVSDRNLYMLKNTRPITVFVELGNIRNTKDQQRFVLESNRQALANWLANGIVADFKNSK
ncbi:MAG: N-acetylmuramoyl-L-alanine amidase [Cytophagaceae bacterium]|jgi:N-acetylmuramoyl-L-alanine amidase|nr:N-acetylmuramoyl-L-alanine amidase [Cytophagaceae bacterium]